MNSSKTAEPDRTTRREFLRTSAKAAAGAALASAIARPGYTAENNTINLALVGCGGRGGGAVGDAIAAGTLPVKLVAMADVVEQKMTTAFNVLSKNFPGQIDVPPDRRFLGFDAYKRAIDCLKPGDVVIAATHAGFRPIHVEYAVQKGIHVFMEKSFAPDPGGTQRMLRAGAEAEKKNLKVGCGLMCRYSSARLSLIQKVRDGELGQIQLIRAYRMAAGARMGRIPAGESELVYQIRHPYFFYWVSNGWFIDHLIHHIDECCWLKDGWPVSAQGLGGRVPDGEDCSQNWHQYVIEYTFADGTKALVNGRTASKCSDDFVTYFHATKGAAQFSGNIHAPTVQTFKDQRTDRSNIAWKSDKETLNPYHAEWQALLAAIRDDKKHNETQRACNTNYACLMGRAAVHTGQIVTWDQITSSNFQFAPDADSLTAASPAPVQPDAKGHYPVPVPGTWKEI